MDASTEAVSAAVVDAPPPPAFDVCAHVVLLDAQRKILTFDPKSRSLEVRARASCDFGNDIGPRTMSVDPSGKIWAATYAGSIVKIDPHDGACERTAFVTNASKLDLVWHDDALLGATENALVRIDSKTFESKNAMSAQVSLLAGNLFAERGASIVKIDLAKKKIEMVVKIDQQAPMAFFEGALYLFQGSEGLTHQEQTAGGLRYDLASKAFERVLEVYDGTIVSAGSCVR